MGQLKINTRKTSGTYNRIIYMVFKNTSNPDFPKTKFHIRVKEGSKVVHQADYHSIGPLNPGEKEEHVVSGVLKRGMFVKQDITLTIAGETHKFSVGAFG